MHYSISCSGKTRTYLSDADVVIPKALAQELGHVDHQLCLWHINKNVTSQTSVTVAKTFSRLASLDTLEDFEVGWNQLMDVATEDEKAYLTAQWYPVRAKWARCFTKQYVNFGMTSTQRSESVNKCIKELMETRSSLAYFMESLQKWNVILQNGSDFQIWREQQSVPTTHVHPIAEICRQELSAFAFERLVKPQLDIAVKTSYRVTQLAIAGKCGSPSDVMSVQGPASLCEVTRTGGKSFCFIIAKSTGQRR